MTKKHKVLGEKHKVGNQQYMSSNSYVYKALCFCESLTCALRAIKLIQRFNTLVLKSEISRTWAGSYYCQRTKHKNNFCRRSLRRFQLFIRSQLESTHCTRNDYLTENNQCGKGLLFIHPIKADLVHYLTTSKINNW